MKKTLLLIIVCIMTWSANAQRIYKNEVDPFNGTRVIETGCDFINGGVVGGSLLGFESVNNIPFLVFYYYKGMSMHVNTFDKLMFLDEEGNKYTFLCVNGGYRDSFKFIGDFESLVNKRIIKGRLKSKDEYLDIEIKKKKHNYISDTYKLFKAEALKHFSDGFVNTGDIVKMLDSEISDNEKTVIINSILKGVKK